MNSISYTLKCEVCNAAKPEVRHLLGEHEIDNYLIQVYTGEVTRHHLPVWLYLKIVRDLTDNLQLGVGKIPETNKEKYTDMVAAMLLNIYLFGAAKTYQLTSAIEAQLSDGGARRPFTGYVEKAKPIASDYLGAYQTVEGDTALRSGKQGKAWQRATIREADFPYLEYVTKKDNRVRPSHEILDGIIRKVNDPFWTTFYPPNGWMCRCKTAPHKEGESTDLRSFDRQEMLKNIPDEFRFNCGLEKRVFSRKHPYFKVPNEDKPFALKNFNLPIPNGKQV